PTSIRPRPLCSLRFPYTPLFRSCLTSRSITGRFLYPVYPRTQKRLKSSLWRFLVLAACYLTGFPGAGKWGEEGPRPYAGFHFPGAPGPCKWDSVILKNGLTMRSLVVLYLNSPQLATPWARPEFPFSISHSN